jgi:hypothetical protein
MSSREETRRGGEGIEAAACHGALTNGRGRTRCIRIAKREQHLVVAARRGQVASANQSNHRPPSAARPTVPELPFLLDGDGDGDCDVDESPPGIYILSGWLDLLASCWSFLQAWTSPTSSLHTWSGLIGRGTTPNTTTPRAPRLPSSTCCDGKGRNRDANFTMRSLTRTPCPLRLVPQRPASSTRPAATRCSIHHKPSRARHHTYGHVISPFGISSSQ